MCKTNKIEFASFSSVADTLLSSLSIQGVLTLFGAYLLYSQVRNDGCDPSGALENLNTSCEPDGQNIMGALIGM
jgi:hypothetical protein